MRTPDEHQQKAELKRRHFDPLVESFTSAAKMALDFLVNQARPMLQHGVEQFPVDGPTATFAHSFGTVRTDVLDRSLRSSPDFMPHPGGDYRLYALNGGSVFIGKNIPDGELVAPATGQLFDAPVCGEFFHSHAMVYRVYLQFTAKQAEAGEAVVELDFWVDGRLIAEERIPIALGGAAGVDHLPPVTNPKPKNPRLRPESVALMAPDLGEGTEG